MIFQATGYHYNTEKMDISWDLARILLQLDICHTGWWFDFRDRSAEVP